MANFVGNNQANTLEGTAGDDSFQARAGNDTISALGGNDKIDAGAGNDTAQGGAGDDVVAASTGNDTARGGSGNDLIAAGPGTDLLAAGAGNNTLTGGPGADTFVIDLGVGGGNEINLITDFEDDTDQIHLLFDGDPLGMARVGAIEEVAANSAPNNALNEDDTAAVTVLDGDIFDVLQFDAFFVPGLDSSDVLNVADVNQLALDVQAGGTDLFLV